MSGTGSTVESGTRRRWLIRLLVLFALVAAFVTERGVRHGDERSAEPAGGAAPGARPDVGGAGATSAGGAISREARRRTGNLPVITSGALRLEGLVVDQDDRPTAGAHVTIGPGREVTTEADGGFAFDGLAEGEYDVVAEHGDQYAEAQDTRLDDTSEPVTIQLVRGPTLVIHVTDEAARPLEAATVQIVSRSYVTGPDGVARIRGVDLDSQHVNVSAPGHASAHENVETSDDPAATIEKTIALRGGAAISGTVVDRDGKRVVEAYVELEPAGGGRSETAWTDDQGRWQLPDVGRGRYVIRASSPVAIAVADVPLAHDGAHAQQDVVLHVEPGGEIAGIVVDTAGHPVPEARVSGGSIGETTDKDGRFVAKGLLPDKYELSASTPMLGAVNQVLVLGRGQHADVKIVLSPSSLAGTVVDAHGDPVEDAAVFARSETPDGYGYDRTDAYGHFDLGGLPPGRYQITAQRDGSHVESAVVEAPTGNRAVRLTVPDPAVVTGRVLLAGKPVPYYGFVIGDDATDTYTHPTPVRDVDGRFTQKDAMLGTFAVIIVGPGFSRRVVENVRVTSGQVVDLGDITVERGESIRGRVVDERGVGIGGATVAVISSRSSYGTTGLRAIMQGAPSAQSDERGNYEIVGVPSSTEERTIQAAHPTRGASTLKTLAAGETTADLVVTATGSIDGTVVHARRDLSLVVASLADDPRARFYGDLDSLGAFRFPQLPPGSYDVDLLGRSSVPTQHVTVTAGATARVTFELPEIPTELRVHVRGECPLISLRTAGDELLALESCTDGVATFRDVRAGAYQLCGDELGCRPVQVTPAPTIDVEL